MTLTDILICPLCGAPLTKTAEVPAVFRCAAGHAYDEARAGYVNLLPPGKGRNKKTGDERPMIRARAAFLRRGFYDPADRAAASLLKEHLPGESGEELLLCDMGAGEGTHTAGIALTLARDTGRSVYALGFDASKHGAESGCRYAHSLGLFPEDGEALPAGSARVLCLPANLFRLPVKNGAADAALSLFAPIAWEEAARILKKDGLFLVISAGREHLIELRRVLYDEVRLTDFHPEAASDTPFTLLERREIDFPLELESPEDIGNLFAMTPVFHRVPERGRERLAALNRLTVTARMELSLWRKTDDRPVPEPAAPKDSDAGGA